MVLREIKCKCKGTSEIVPESPGMLYSGADIFWNYGSIKQLKNVKY